jgi:hypothetical protein
MKHGDTVDITEVPEEDYKFFAVGDKAVLVWQDDSGDWWADFTQNANTYKAGVWCIQEGFAKCKVIKAA